MDTTNYYQKRNTLTSNYANYKHDYPILEYQEKFRNNYKQMKGSLANISTNITSYKHEIVKLEDFLVVINDHEKNYKILSKKLNVLKKIIEESIEIESLIGKLSSNQQIINISEYVNLHAKVHEIIKYFQDSNLNDKKDFEANITKLMLRAFKVYEETFYVILKRYDQIQVNTNTENERMNLLNKIRSLADCLQDDSIKYDFTSKLIREKRDAILGRFDEIKIITKYINEDNYERNCGLITNILMESEKLFKKEQEYIFRILSTCTLELRETVYSEIIESPLERILSNLRELLAKHTKTNVKRLDFYQNFDILNIWYEKTNSAFQELVQKYNKGVYDKISSIIKLIENFCYQYMSDFVKDNLLLNEKIETENVLKTCNDTIFFLSHLLLFETAYHYIKNEFKSTDDKFSIENIIDSLLKKLEIKSSILEKKYPPLKYIFLINNVYFIQSKIYQKPFNKYVSKSFADNLTKVIEKYISSYLESSWYKVLQVTFNEKDNLVYEQDGKTLKNSSKEIVKKKFATFNETMKLNLKFQQQLQIIETSLEKKLIDSNIEYLTSKYEAMFDKFANSGFTKFKNKYIIYGSKNDVIQDLKLYFMPGSSMK